MKPPKWAMPAEPAKPLEWKPTPPNTRSELYGLSHGFVESAESGDGTWYHVRFTGIEWEFTHEPRHDGDLFVQSGYQSIEEAKRAALAHHVESHYRFNEVASDAAFQAWPEGAARFVNVTPEMVHAEMQRATGGEGKLKAAR